MWWRIFLAFWNLAAFRNAPIRYMFFRLVLLCPHYLVNGNFLCTDLAKWRKENVLAGHRRQFCLCPVDVGIEASGATPAWLRDKYCPFCQKSCKSGCSLEVGSQCLEAGGLIIWPLLVLVGSTAALSAKKLFSNLKAIGCRQEQPIFKA